MKASVLVLALIVAVACAQVIADTPAANPAVSMDRIKRLANHGKCQVRPATAVQIQRMRDGAKKMAAMVQKEVLIAAKRRAYIEQMTNYINDRIRELNKVKTELKEEIAWIETTNDRIQAIAQQEKVARYQDVVQCLENKTSDQSLQHDQDSQSLGDMQAKMKDSLAMLDGLKSKIAASHN